MISRASLFRQLAPLVRKVDELALRRLCGRNERLARAIAARDDGSSPLVAEIERRRAEMMADDRPLVDGKLGPQGIYDGDNKTIADACRVSKPPRPAYLLYVLGKTFGPTTVIELGTNAGISSAYIAAGLTGGDLTTLESSPYRLRLAQRLHQSLGLRNISYVQGLFADTLPATLKSMSAVDMAFIDGHHQYQPTLDYFDLVWRHSTENCIFVFDDIRWSAGMKRAWQELRRDSRMVVVADLWSVGVCITSRQGSNSGYRTMPMLSVLR